MENYQQIMQRLQDEGRISAIHIDPSAMAAMNKEMEKVKRDSIRMQAESALLARTIILTD